MKFYSTIIMSLTLGIFFLLAWKEQKTSNTNTRKAVAVIAPKSESGLYGRVTFTETDGKVRMHAEISGASQGDHAIHIHAVGDCSAPDGSSAGGHWNPTGEDHGKWDQRPFHLGDIGNISVNENGKGSISRETNLWCIGCGDEDRDILGKAIIVHQGIDDFSTQPSGAAGARIGCGEILEK